MKELATSLASRSDHPVFKTIFQGLDMQAPDARNFKALPGRKVAGVVNGQPLVLGNHRLIHERGLCDPELEAKLAAQEEQGRTVTLLTTDSDVLAMSAVADTIRKTSRQAVADFKALGIRPVMLTGHNTPPRPILLRRKRG